MSAVASQQKVAESLRGQYHRGHEWLERTLGEITAAQLSYQPAGNVASIAAQYGHILTTEDLIINAVLKGESPILANGDTGLSELPPTSLDWQDWGRRVQIDLGMARAYAEAVYAATDTYLASLADNDLDRPLDLTNLGLGTQTVGSLLNLVLTNLGNHCGEISAIKGLQGLKGYPV